VIPTGYARVGNTLYLHGSTASRMVRSLAEGVDVSVAVTLVDGLVLARSAFHHSINYRSVVVFGRARLVTDTGEKVAALRAFTNHVVPGRWDEVRAPTDQELKATAVLALGLDEASAKVRTGPPIDDEIDLSWPVWAGVVPLRLATGVPVADLHLLEGVGAFASAGDAHADARLKPSRSIGGPLGCGIALFVRAQLALSRSIARRGLKEREGFSRAIEA
jgi:nitroimidazol reductase NimA-like FMN-containing flavoprotein (pyridoxamine 5'-phosphate oxidase superfamily)